MMVKDLLSVELTNGLCAVCRREIEGERSLGSSCKNCSSEDLFRSQHVEVVVKKTLRFNPVLGVYKFLLDFTGTRAVINGRLATITSTAPYGGHVQFEDGSKKSVYGLGWKHLCRIVIEEGGEIEPPPLPFPEHIPTPTTLLDQPVAPVIIDRQDGVVRSVSVGGSHWELREKVPFIYDMIQAFTNLYVRFKFGLDRNQDYHVPGGFVGVGFIASNSRHGVGFELEVNPVHESLSHLTDKEFDSKVLREGLMAMLDEQEWGLQEHPTKPATVDEVVALWVTTMETLLRYDWSGYSIDIKTQTDRLLSDEPLMGVESTWQVYCTMQDVLVNIIPEDELKRALKFSAAKRSTVTSVY